MAHLLGGLVSKGDGQDLAGRARPDPMRWAILAVMTRVLPEPAPARMRSGPSVCSTASRWAGLSESRKSTVGVSRARCRSHRGYHRHLSSPRPSLIALGRHGSHALPEGLGHPRGSDARQRADAALHRAASGPRGHQPAGICRDSRARVARARARAHVRDVGPHRPHQASGSAVRRRHGREHDERARESIAATTASSFSTWPAASRASCT